MEVTMEYVDTLLDHVAATAKVNREAKGYDGEFLPVAVVVGPEGQQVVLPMNHRTNREKRDKYDALAQAAKDSGVVAIVVVHNARWTDSQKFGDYFHLPPISEVGLEVWEKEYLSVINGIYGGSLGNCPRELWHEAIIIAVKGPLIEPKSRMMYYRQGAGNTVEWLGTPELLIGGDDIETRMGILDDWWEVATKI